VNEAYRTLKDPVQRARHLLELHGVDVAFETNTAMPADFLAQQMELRDAGGSKHLSVDALRKTQCRSPSKGHRGSDRREEGLSGAAGW
jgi:molecular chaperone HscB